MIRTIIERHPHLCQRGRAQEEPCISCRESHPGKRGNVDVISFFSSRLTIHQYTPTNGSYKNNATVQPFEGRENGPKKAKERIISCGVNPRSKRQKGVKCRRFVRSGRYSTASSWYQLERRAGYSGQEGLGRSTCLFPKRYRRKRRRKKKGIEREKNDARSFWRPATQQH